MSSNNHYIPSNYTSIEKRLLQSTAWLSLTGVAPQVYSIFMLKRRLIRTNSRKRGRENFICTNSKELEFTYTEAEKQYGISGYRFRRAIDQLIEHGFIEIVEQGGGLLQIKTLYGLSERWRKFGTPEFVKTERIKRLHTYGFCKPAEKKNKH